MQHAVQEHGTMAVGDYNAIAIPPVRMGRIVLVIVVEQHLNDVGRAHWYAWITARGPLNGIHGQGPHRIGELKTICIQFGHELGWTAKSPTVKAAHFAACSRRKQVHSPKDYGPSRLPADKRHTNLQKI